MPRDKKLAEIACNAMNAIGFSITALEQLKKGEPWQGDCEVALKAAQDVYRPFLKVYDYLAYGEEDIS